MSFEFVIANINEIYKNEKKTSHTQKKKKKHV